MNSIIAYFFLFEVSVKTISMGVYFGKNAFLKDNFNKVDFSIVLLSFIDLYIDSNISFIRVYIIYLRI